MKRAGFWRRTAAMTIDILIALLPSAMFAGILWNSLARGGTVDETTDRLVGAVPLLAWIGYFLLEVFAGVTLGKMLMRISIRRSDGIPADRWTLLLRYITKHQGFLLSAVYVATDIGLFYGIAGFMNFLVLIGCLRALGEGKQTWHDLWSHTAVFVNERATVGFPVASPDEPIGAPPPT